MKTFLLDIIPKIQSYSYKLDNIALLANKHWVLITDEREEKTVYIFRSNNELLLAVNGNVTKGRWEYLSEDSLLIDISDKSYLFKHGFLDSEIIALKSDNKDNYSVLVNENNYNGGLNSINSLYKFLETKYLQSDSLIYNDRESRNSPSPQKINIKEIVPDKAFQPHPVGQVLIYLSLAGCLIYIITFFDNFRYHILNDESMCPCPMDVVMSKNFTWFVFKMLAGMFTIGIILILRRNFKKVD